MKKKKAHATAKKKQIHTYLRQKNRFDDLLTKKEKQQARVLWYKNKYKYANGEIRKWKC